MNSKVLESLMIPEENLKVANEGIGAEIAKLAGKGILKILKHLAILLGISIGTSALLIGSNVAAQKKAANKRQNLTDDEKKSKSNYINTWKPELMKFNKMIMEEIGLDVDVAEDGTDAVNIMSSERGSNYDLIFMDIQMPKMDGYTATREIRTLNNTKCANIPIIAMTANAFEEDRKKAIKAGMNGHIAKPISSEVILENLDQIFGR